MIDNKKIIDCDFCVVGGGLAGTIAALSAARHGAKVVLMQDRPMLGGNCSSEIKMWVRGAKGKYNRETGILEEFEEENIYRNPTLAHTLWDSVLYGKIKENKNITLLLNCSCLDAECENGIIKSVTGWQLTTYTFITVRARLFSDCSGDSVLAYLSGAAFRKGREAKDEYNETAGKEKSDSKTMGNSCLLQARETDHPVKFIPPEWANKYVSDEDFAIIPQSVGLSKAKFRDHKIGTNGCNLWWIEVGGDGDALHDAEDNRDELLKIVFGIWDHIKNYGDHGCENWELEWVGFLPGKRETNRYIGEYVLNENDIESGGRFDDTVAYGGWPIDDHNPKGMKANSKSEGPAVAYPASSPYGIPYRCLYSANIKNLFFAGRNISVTHVALSSTRVMATCSLLGQAVGTAAAICVENGILPSDIKNDKIKILQKMLMDDGVFLPDNKREISNVTLCAETNLSKEQEEILFNGIERPRSFDGENAIELNKGFGINFKLEQKTYIETLRIMFDLDFERKSSTPNKKMQWFPQKLNQGLDFVPVKVPNTIVKDFDVLIDGEVFLSYSDNYNSLVFVPVKKEVSSISVVFKETWGAETVRIFGCDFY